MTISRQLYKNNARSTLAVGINGSDLTITVATGEGSKFPTPGAGEFFLVTLEVGSSNEIVKIISRTGDSLTVDPSGRGWESTVAATWPMGSLIEMRITKGTLEGFARLSDRVADIASVDDLVPPSQSNANSYLTQSLDDQGSPILAVAATSSNQWTFPSFTIAAATGTVAGSTSTTGFTATGGDLSSLSTFAAGKYLVQFTSGALSGLVRRVTSLNTGTGALTWATSTGSAPVIGTTFKIYQSDASSIVLNSGSFVLKAGDTMSGPLVLSGNASSNLHPVTKQQWDAQNLLLAPLANPAFTGTPQLPSGTVAVTQSPGNSTTAVATTAFVTAADNLKANLASPTFTGTPTLPTGTIAVTQTPGDNTTAVATTAFVTAAVGLKANLASPTFSGTPSLPTGTVAVTQSPGNNTTAVATTAFVASGLALKADINSPTFTGTPSLPTGTTGVTQSPGDSTTKLATTAFVATGLALKADLASPNLSGVPTAPTATLGTNTVQLATCQFVQSAITSASVLWQGSSKTVSASGPSGGVDGDFWFQYI